MSCLVQCVCIVAPLTIDSIQVSAVPSKLSKMQPPSHRSKTLLERSFVKPQSNLSKSNMNRSLNSSASESQSSTMTNGNADKKVDTGNKMRYSGAKRSSLGLSYNGQTVGRGASLVKAPSSSVYQTSTSKDSHMKGPATKLQLMNPGQLQKRTLTKKAPVRTMKAPAGPMKAPAGQMKAPSVPMKAPAGCLKAPTGLMKPHTGSLKGTAGTLKGPMKATVPMTTREAESTKSRTTDSGKSGEVFFILYNIIQVIFWIFDIMAIKKVF